MTSLTIDGAWPANMRELVDLELQEGAWPVVIWALKRGERVSRAIETAGEEYAALTGMAAEFAMIGSIPQGAEEFSEVGNMTLVRADWVKEGFIVIARGCTKVYKEEYKRWRKI
jgi:hypothetical protein